MDSRLLNVNLTGVSEQPLLIAVSGRDNLSYPYEFKLEVITEDRLFDQAKSLLGTPAYFTLTQSEQTQLYHGIIEYVQEWDVSDEGYLTHLYLVPWFKTLTLSRDYRCFVNQSVIDIVKTLFQAYGFTDCDFSQLTQTYPPLPFTVQHGETTFNFISRLLEVHGIYYYFVHTEDKHVMTFCDSGLFNQNPYGQALIYSEGSETANRFFRWQREISTVPKKITYLGYNFEFSKTPVTLSSAVPGGDSGNTAEQYTHIGTTSADNNVLQRFINLKSKQWALSKTRVKGQSTYLGLYPGAQFELSDHIFKEEVGSYYIYSISIEAKDHSQRKTSLNGNETLQEYTNTISAYPVTSRFVPLGRYVDETQIKIKKPIAPATTAVITGPKDQDMYTDSYGRVKLQFHFDRYGKKDENSSNWVRTRQMWAGNGYGTQFIPRIGDEVLVDFYHGDPDQPVVIAGMPNNNNLPPFKTTSQSGFKSHTLGSSNATDGNILRFDDTSGAEEVYIKAQKDLTTTVQGNSIKTVGGNSTTQVNKGNYVQIVNGILTVQAQKEIRIACGSSAIVINAGGVTLQADSITMQQGAIPPAQLKPVSNATTAGINQMLKSKSPAAAPSTTSPPLATGQTIDGEIVDVVYSTGDQGLFFLTAADQAAIRAAEKPLMEASQALYQAEQQAASAQPDENGKLPDNVTNALQQARQKMNLVLETYCKSDTLAEILKFSDGISQEGWSYIPNAVLAKVKLASYVNVDNDGNVTYSTSKSTGTTSAAQAGYTKTEGQAGQGGSSTSSKKVSITDAKQAILNTHPTSGNVFQFDSATYDGNLNQIASKLEQSTSFQAQQATSWVTLKASDQDRILRYTAQTGVNGGYDPKTKTLTLNANAQATLDLFNASITSSATFPSDNGYHFVIKPDGQDSLDLGYFKAELDLTLYENSGASIVAYGNVTASPNPNYQPAPPNSNQSKTADTSGNLIKGRLADGSGAQADVGFFAGVAAGCNMDGKFFWKNPESVTPVQNPSKQSEVLGSPQGQGQPTWQELADLGYGVEGDAGAGAEVEFKITYYNGRFVISCHAKVVWGVGASGKIQIVIDEQHILEFIQFVFHQIKNYNFNYTGLVDDTAFGQLNFILLSSLWTGAQLTQYASYGFTNAKQWFITNVIHHNDICTSIVELATNINNNQQQIKFLPPEAKGRLLYQLSQYFTYYEKIDPAPAQAILKILSYVQSSNEWIKVLQNVVKIDPDNMSASVSAVDGQKTLLSNLQVKDISAVLNTEFDTLNNTNTMILQSQQAYRNACQRVSQNYNINLQNAYQKGHFEVLAGIQINSSNLRSCALQKQAINQMQVDQAQFEQLMQLTNDQMNYKINKEVVRHYWMTSY